MQVHFHSRIRLTLTAVFVFLFAFLISVQDASSQASSDNFNDNLLDISRWVEVMSGTNTMVRETNQQVEVLLSANASGAVFSAGYESIFELSGDFDIEVEYVLLDWPTQSGVRIGLSADGIGSVERVGFGAVEGGGEVYLTNLFDGVQGVTPTTDMAGKLRLERVGDSITGYYFDSDLNAWVGIHSSLASTSDVKIRFNVWSHDYAFADQDTLVAFDNFVVNQGLVVQTPLVALPHQITDQIAPMPAAGGETFFTDQFLIDYKGEKILLSQYIDSEGSTLVDDAIEIIVDHLDGTTSTFVHAYAVNCAGAAFSLPPHDISHLFTPGQNIVSVRLYDICGVAKGSSFVALGMPTLCLAPSAVTDLSISQSEGDNFLDWTGSGLSTDVYRVYRESFFPDPYFIPDTSTLEAIEPGSFHVDFGRAGILDDSYIVIAANHCGDDVSVSASSRVGEFTFPLVPGTP